MRVQLRAKLDIWRSLLVQEFKALRQPPLSAAQAQLSYFQMRSFQLGLSDARRMMGDGDARQLATVAFEGLLDRLAAVSA